MIKKYHNLKQKKSDGIFQPIHLILFIISHLTNKVCFIILDVNIKNDPVEYNY